LPSFELLRIYKLISYSDNVIVLSVQACHVTIRMYKTVAEVYHHAPLILYKWVDI